MKCLLYSVKNWYIKSNKLSKLYLKIGLILFFSMSLASITLLTATLFNPDISYLSPYSSQLFNTAMRCLVISTILSAIGNFIMKGYEE